jgi:hypothetical protein
MQSLQLPVVYRIVLLYGPDLLLWWYPLWMRDIWSYLVYDLHLSLFSGPEARIWYSSSTKLSFWCRNATLDNHLGILTSFAQSEIS